MLDGRQRWVLNRLVAAFGLEKDAAEALENFLSEDEPSHAMTSFFKPDGNAHLFCTGAGLGQEGGKTAVFTMTNSVMDDTSRERCIYFVRQGIEKALQEKDLDTWVQYGEFSGNLLSSLASMVTHLYQPMLNRYSDWGKSTEENTKEFVGCIGRFSDTLQDAVRDLKDTVDLRPPDAVYHGIENKAAAFLKASSDPACIDHMESVIEEWIRQLGTLVATPEGSKDDESGPASEMEFWRGRMTRLTSVLELLRHHEYKVVLGVLKACSSHKMKKWKAVYDVQITDALNEAKDNVKYLSTLESHTVQLYEGTPNSIVDSLPGLLTHLKMMYGIARFYNTPEQMTTLFIKITNQMIVNCKDFICNGKMGTASYMSPWDQEPSALLKKLQAGIDLNDAYKDAYRNIRDRTAPGNGRQPFDFSENQIFGKLDLCCKRFEKLTDLFTTVEQFRSLSDYNIEGMDNLIATFNKIVEELRVKPYSLLDFQKNQFDRDYVEFNINIHELELALQGFINSSFENIMNTEQALALLQKFQAILQRKELKGELDNKLTRIFHNYGLDLENVQREYEKSKDHPPIPRNSPPVAGKVTWSRHLLRRIEEPMKRFQSNRSIMGTKESRKIIKTYNKVAKALIAFETLWIDAWAQAIAKAKAGLQATLIVRHPVSNKLFVNFDRDVLQLIRETKWLQRMDVEVPESARIVLLQESKFKVYFQRLQDTLLHYDSVTGTIIERTRPLLKPHLDNLQGKLEPGLNALTWTSMNIDTYLNSVHSALSKLHDLILRVNDVIEGRIEYNLKLISKTLLVDTPDTTVSLDNFVISQEKHIKIHSAGMDATNLAIETAVKDVLIDIQNFPLDGDESAAMAGTSYLREVTSFKTHYSNLLYMSLINSTKKSLTVIKNRVCARTTSGFLYVDRPFFDVDVELQVPDVVMNPSLEEIQYAINRAIIAILSNSKRMYLWDTDRNNPDEADTFYHLIAADKDICKMCLLLTGSIEGLKAKVLGYLDTFREYDYLFLDDKATKYALFMETKPEMEDFENELKKYSAIEASIAQIAPVCNIGSLSLETQTLKNALKYEATSWKNQYATNLHAQAKHLLDSLTDYMKNMTMRLDHTIDDLDDVRFIMDTIEEIKTTDSEVDSKFGPVIEQYDLLAKYEVRIQKSGAEGEEDEVERVGLLYRNWKFLLDRAEQVSDEFGPKQDVMMKGLQKDVVVYRGVVDSFASDYFKNGPMTVKEPSKAMELLKSYGRNFAVEYAKYETYYSGEDLFGLPHVEYPDIQVIKKELEGLNQLYGLYDTVIKTIRGYEEMLWVKVVESVETMENEVKVFQGRARQLPKDQKDWPAYVELKKTIDDFLELLPLMQQFSHPAILPRHWQKYMEITGREFRTDKEFFKLSNFLLKAAKGAAGSDSADPTSPAAPSHGAHDLTPLTFKEELEDLALGAVKERIIEDKLGEIKDKWSEESFTFQNYKARGMLMLGGTIGETVEKLDESSSALAGMMAQRFVKPFKEQVQAWLNRLADISEVIEQWIKVQSTWMYLEAVFSSGDIAKQLPQETKRFQNIDKTWVKIMSKAVEVRKIRDYIEDNEFLKTSLPSMDQQLEMCQKSLSGYLEQKRGVFPRFYFASDGTLLEILSKSSDPHSIQSNLQNVFDSLCTALFDKTDKNKLVGMESGEGEVVMFDTPFSASGNIEDWLGKLEGEMQNTMKCNARNCAADANELPLQEIIDKYPGQISLLGIQFQWTFDCEDALRRAKHEKTAMSQTSKKINTLFQEMLSITTQANLLKRERTQIETMITIDVHQKDVFDDLMKQKVKQVDDFEWQKQARFYWSVQEDDCYIDIADARSRYCNEYLGIKERLVITALTDRCYITLTQALSMYFGGAPAGPAGTGKTETTKDLGRTLGKYVVVFNCSDQYNYLFVAKIFKGLCQSGAWGCFDEFNRILLEVLSVVAQQVLYILDAMKARKEQFLFPTDNQLVTCSPYCGFFITMNPGYAGRQELPENLKALFRGVTMMVPNRQVIMKVKLASYGFLENDGLSWKFFILYELCEQQLSKVAHYDFGLRNILSVLRTAGTNKRTNLSMPESHLVMRTLRDINISKFVAEDVPLFHSLIKDLFPGIDVPKAKYADIEKAIEVNVKSSGQSAGSSDPTLILHERWVFKIVQLYETFLVRHSIMLVGASMCGKTQIQKTLIKALTDTQPMPYQELRMNPKSITAEQMFGRDDPLTHDWTDGIFADLWRKGNAKGNKKFNFITLDGPVDAVWIENLNTVMDDNKLLTLANGDRIPMSADAKLMFEVEDLNNASPATVSRAGIIYISAVELNWQPLVTAWLMSPIIKVHSESLQRLFDTYVETMIEYCIVNKVKDMMNLPLPSKVTNCMTMLQSLLEEYTSPLEKGHYERLFLYSMSWSLAGLAENDDRQRFDGKLRELAPKIMPACEYPDTIFDFVCSYAGEWERWDTRLPKFVYSADDSFASLLVPTADSYRMLGLIDLFAQQEGSVLLVGDAGTCKTSIALQYIANFDPDVRVSKKMNFSSATTHNLFQGIIEGSVEKKIGKTFCPMSHGQPRKMTVVVDDLSMPLCNEWGDQPTAEIVRQLMEWRGVYNLENPGEFKQIIDLSFVGLMQHPGGGKNDIPNRLKTKFACFNLTMPSQKSIEQMFGNIVNGCFSPDSTFEESVLQVSNKIVDLSIEVWQKVKAKMLPTPVKFHYLFNIRDLSRVFQGVILAAQPPKYEVPPAITGPANISGSEVITSANILLALWMNECGRVFSDKLIDIPDQTWFEKMLLKTVEEEFGDQTMEELKEGPECFCNFMRAAPLDPETGEECGPAPKVYEPAPGGLHALRETFVMPGMESYNEHHKSKKLNLVLFDDALNHVLRISRIIGMERGSALLVGVGGSGKQSLCRLASHIACYSIFQIQISKSYGVSQLFDDMRNLFQSVGVTGKPCTFIFTDAEVKEESFLEYLNTFLATGEIPNLMTKEDEDMAAGEDSVLKAFQHKYPSREPTGDALKAFFKDRVRSNLHLVLCFSPVGPKLVVRSRKFPGLFNCCSIDWFLRWPQAALIDVSTKFIGDYKVHCEAKVKEQLILHMAEVHDSVQNLCELYFQKYRRNVYVTPKSYLSFLELYKTIYSDKYAGVQVLADQINGGLQKLQEAGVQVADMGEELKLKKKDLEEAERQSAITLEDLQTKTGLATKEKEQVMVIKQACVEEAEKIGRDKQACEEDLAAAQPALMAAESALAAINEKDLQMIKALPNPPFLIKYIMDAVCVLMMHGLSKVSVVQFKESMKINPSWDSSKSLIMDRDFVNKLKNFPKDQMNEETIELLGAYLKDPQFHPDEVTKSSPAIAGVCAWCKAMDSYYVCSKVVKPKLEALARMEAVFEKALASQKVAEDGLAQSEMQLKKLQDGFEKQMQNKARIQEDAVQTQRRMDQATSLISGLDGEKTRWTKQSEDFADEMRRLTGDCAVASAFVSYLGPFNQEFRGQIIKENMLGDCIHRKIFVTQNLNVSTFLVDEVTVGDWGNDGLPSDDLSVQNGILVTLSSRYPLMVDPQMQGHAWVKSKESRREAGLKVTQLTEKHFQNHLVDSMAIGRSLLIEHVENELDPVLDPVLNKEVIRVGRNAKIVLGDRECEYVDEFNLFITTKLPNPHFSPELCAQTTVIDFTVTMRGLEDQLLGVVILKEKQELEVTRQKLVATVTINKKKMKSLEDMLLQRLASAKGSLVDDDELIKVLGDTKATSKEVNELLEDAAQTEIKISQSREEYRPVAARGSLLYFLIGDMSKVDCMYQTSLGQFLTLFNQSIDTSEPTQVTQKRINNIVETLSYLTWSYLTRGFYTRHRLVFTLLMTLKILMASHELSANEFSAFLKGGAALDASAEKKNPFTWLPQTSWLSVIMLSRSGGDVMKDLPDSMARSEARWKEWYDSEAPESMPVPDYDDRTNTFQKMLIVRSIRMDRALVSAQFFIQEKMGKRYVEEQPLDWMQLYEETVWQTPTIFLLSKGSDPTDDIFALARKRKAPIQSISMGQGQEPNARKFLQSGVSQGGWVLYQNCHLGLNFMVELEGKLVKLENESDNVNEDFRLFITVESHPSFPLGLLQMSIKLCQEPANGIKNGMRRCYAWLNQDRLDVIPNNSQWRQLLYGLCFVHTIVQERRKFGPLGWNTYWMEFNQSDLTACALFLEQHLTQCEGSKSPISWPTVRYMISQAQYGGKITDDFDRRLFDTYCELWLGPKTFESSFEFFNGYNVPDGAEIEVFRKHVEKMSITDSPEVFGMHTNADLTFRNAQAEQTLTTILDVQPKSSGGGGGATREEIVDAMADEFTGKVPPDFNLIEKKKLIEKVAGGPGSPAGFANPLNICLSQEIDRLQHVISMVRDTLKNLRLAIAGTVVMSEQLASAMDAMFDARVPPHWVGKSWVSPNIGVWMSDFMSRHSQNGGWMNNGRPHSFWLSGFFNPQGFLTSVTQEVTRKHAGWAMDEITMYSSVTKEEKESVKEHPQEGGVYIYGLYLEGCAWDKRQDRIVPSKPKEIYNALPLLYVTAVQTAGLKKKDVYDCPVYKMNRRTQLNYIFTAFLRTEDPTHVWVRAGGALMASKD